MSKCLNCGCTLTPCDTPAECQQCIRSTPPVDTIESLRTRIAALEAENKRLVDERDGWKCEAMAARRWKGWRSCPGGPDQWEMRLVWEEEIAANDARAGGKEDGHGN